MTSQIGTGKYEQLLARCASLEPVVTELANAEGLVAHRRAVEVRR